MQYQKSPATLCFGDVRQAALYFDRVVPIAYTWTNQKFDGWYNDFPYRLAPRFVEVMTELTGWSDDIQAHYLLYQQEIHRWSASTYEEFQRLAEKLGNGDREVDIGFLERALAWVQASKDRIPEDPEIGIAAAYLTDLRASQRESVREIVNRFAVAMGAAGSPVLFPPDVLSEEPATDEDITLTLANIPLVDAQQTTWEQLLEFRKDQEARKKLRNLRLFLHSTYKGESRAFIEDDLQRRLDQYQSACRDWGFETTLSGLSLALDSRALPAAFATTAVAVLFGEPFLATAALIGGSAVELGKITVAVASGRHAFHKLKRDHELAYIFEANQRLS